MRSFDSLSDMKQFCGHTAEELRQHGLAKWAEAIQDFSYNSYTTSSEYLGELRLILKEMLSHTSLLPSSLIPDIETAVQAINNAFSQDV